MLDKTAAKTSLSAYNGALPDTAPRSVRVADCTLRDGEQQAGLVFSRERKVKIAKELIAAGIYEIEAGSPAVSPEDRDAVAEIAGLGGAKVSALAIARERDVDVVAETGAWGIRISFPAGVLQLKHKINLSADDWIRRAIAITDYAKSKGLYVIFSPYDTTRAEESFLRRAVREVAQTGAIDRFRVVDTAGSADQASVNFLVSLFREEGWGVPVEVHVHDDFGLATANTVAGVLAGAEYVSTSMNSLGERSGNASTEQVAAVLELMYGIDTGVRLECLVRLAAMVADFSGVAIPPNTPIVGANSFAHESGLVTAGVLVDPFTAEAYAPELVGQRRRLVYGKKSGSRAVGALLAEMGINSEGEQVRIVLNAIKERSLFLERALYDDELKQVVVSASSSSANPRSLS